MKQGELKTLFAMSLLAAIVLLSSFQPPAKYKVIGQISNMKEGTKIKMIHIGTHDEEKPIDSAIVKNGKFMFTGSVAGPRLFYMKIVEQGYNGFQLMVENSVIHVTGNAKLVQNDSIQYQEVTNIKVTGSKTHQQYLEKTSLRESLEKLYQEYNNNNKEILDQTHEAYQKKDSVLYKKLIASDAYKKFEKEEKAFFDTVSTSIRRLVLSNKNTWWGPFLLMNQYSYLTPEQREIYDQFSVKAKNSFYGKAVTAELYPVSYLGKPAPSLAFADEKQQPVSFASMAKGKRYMLIDFWASWCAPCRKAIPELKNFYQEMSSKGVEIISVSIDKDAGDWSKANDAEKFPWHSFLDRQNLANAYGVRAIPAMFLLDGEGKVLAENVTLEEIKAKIR